jgi:hypothetical protein
MRSALRPVHMFVLTVKRRVPRSVQFVCFVSMLFVRYVSRLCLRSEDAFVIICVANLMEVKVLYVQQDLWYEISSYWCFSV